MVGPDGLTFGFFKALAARADFCSSEQTGDTPVSPSPCSQTNSFATAARLVRAVITYHNKNSPQGGSFYYGGAIDTRTYNQILCTQTTVR